MTTIQERRHRDLTAMLARMIGHREDAMAKLVRLDGKVRALRKQLQRYEKHLAKPAPEPRAAPEPPKVEATKAVTDIPVAELPIADDLAIPTFLQRKKAGEARDAAVKAVILAEQAERKKLKANNRIEEMKAKKRGDTKRMPLEGKAALEAIRS